MLAPVKNILPCCRPAVPKFQCPPQQATQQHRPQTSDTAVSAVRDWVWHVTAADIWTQVPSRDPMQCCTHHDATQQAHKQHEVTNSLTSFSCWVHSLQ